MNPLDLDMVLNGAQPDLEERTSGGVFNILLKSNSVRAFSNRNISNNNLGIKEWRLHW